MSSNKISVTDSCYLTDSKHLLMSNIIYYADDTEDKLDILQEVAVSMGSKIDTCATGVELTDALDNPPPVPDIIFVDLCKTKDAYNAVDEIRHSENANVPIVIISEKSNYKIIQKFKDLGANLYIQKSKSYLKLRTAISYALQINWRVERTSSKNFFYNSWF